MSDEGDDKDDHHVRGNDLLARAQSPHTRTATFPKSPQYIVPSPSDPGRPESPPLTATTFKGPPISPKKPLVSRAPSVPPLTNCPEELPSRTALFAGPLTRSRTSIRFSSHWFKSVHSEAIYQIRFSCPCPLYCLAAYPCHPNRPLSRSFCAQFYLGSSCRPPFELALSPPTDDLPAPPVHVNGSTASAYTPSIAPKELSNAPSSRKYTGTTIGLPSPATSASGTVPALAASLSPTSTRFRHASTSSDAPTLTTTPPTVSAPFSQTPATQWTVPQVIAWLQSKGFDNEIQCAFQDNGIMGDILIELDSPALKDEPGREDDKAKEWEKQSSKESSKEKLVVGSRWNGSSRPASAIEDDDDQLKARPLGSTNITSPLAERWRDRHTRFLGLGACIQGRARRSKRGALLIIKFTSSLSFFRVNHPARPTNTKQFFDQPQSQLTLTTTIKTDTKTDPSEAGSTPISSFPPSPLFRREKPEKEKEKEKGKHVKSVTGSEDATSPGHVKKRSIDTSSVTGGARDRLSIFGSALGKGRKPAPRYSASETGAVPAEERSHRSLSRLYMGSGSQRKSKVRRRPV
ncbi:unnamed protein product [Rhizoctonia solani]|uniref:SAM domain-containing protein n=1 Tax=Rhizoctonia solani TaxID=456999 RepID=A0A8H3BA48_9AGAM|nr:unnamed protein product [Rhizoctonia solani]